MKYRLYKDKKHLRDGQVFSTLASKASSGSYYCEAKAKGITKTSMPLVINVKGKQTIYVRKNGESLPIKTKTKRRDS